MDNHFIFLGTGGARFVVSRQLRWTAGIWCCFQGKRILIDPGPGTLVRCFSEEINLNPEQLDAIIVTHRHLDHSTDANVMVESMTKGTFTRRGALFAPGDALNTVEPVIFSYLRESVERVEVLREGGEYFVGNVRFSSPIRHLHGVETYGLKFTIGKKTVSFIADTFYFPGLAEHYRADILVLNVVLYEHPGYKKIEHLDLANAEKIITLVKPQKAILTHFGTTMLKNDPAQLAEKMAVSTGCAVIAAEDGMKVSL